MAATTRSKLSAGGRLVIPAEMRQALDLAIGDPVLLELDGASLRIRSVKAAVAEIQALARPYRPKKGSAVAELIAERRAEAARE
jgi:bifunctional DNA-binding transcriptional regulator/antitoxin component of YhaV-PrlF toxin-antitoxin module